MSTRVRELEGLDNISAEVPYTKSQGAAKVQSRYLNMDYRKGGWFRYSWSRYSRLVQRLIAKHSLFIIILNYLSTTINSVYFFYFIILIRSGNAKFSMATYTGLATRNIFANIFNRKFEIHSTSRNVI